MAHALLGIAVETRYPPHVRRVDTLVQIFRIEPLVSLIRVEGFWIESRSHRIEVEEIFRGLCEPRDLFVTVGEKALRAHSIRIVPDDEVGQQHAAVSSEPSDETDQVSGSGFGLILQPSEQREI